MDEEFINNLSSDENKVNLTYLSEDDKEFIAKHLDIRRAWLYIAEKCGLKPTNITWIQHRHNEKGSEALAFLKEVMSVPLKRFITALKESEQVVVPVIEYLEKRYPEIVERYHRDQRTMQNCSTFPKLRVAPVDKTLRVNSKYQSSFCRLETTAFQCCKRKTHVLLAYLKDDLRIVLNMAKCLVKNGFAVSIDDQEELSGSSFRAETRYLERIQKIFHSAQYVLLVISPAFCSAFKDGNLTIGDSASNPQLSLHYIVKLMRAEVEGAKGGRRFVAVLTKGTGIDDVPFWLRNSRAYHWPDEYKNLFFFIIDPQSIIKSYANGKKELGDNVVKISNCNGANGSCCRSRWGFTHGCDHQTSLNHQCSLGATCFSKEVSGSANHRQRHSSACPRHVEASAWPKGPEDESYRCESLPESHSHRRC